MKYPFFSIVIPAYNAAKFIRQTLDSVRMQTFADHEMILVNDGSKDNTLEVIKTYFNDFPHLKHKIISQENKGIGGARNSGVKVASGEFVAFLDADDRWYKEKLSEVKSSLDKSSNTDLVCHDEHLVKDGKIVKKIVYGPYTSYKDLLFKGNCISTSATVVRRSKLLEAGLFSENLAFNSIEDYELWLRLSKIGTFVYLHKILGRYNIYDSSITKNIQQHMENSFSVLDHHFSQWENKSFYYRWLINKRKAEVMRATAYIFIKINQFKSAAMLLKKSLKLDVFSLKIWATMLIFLAKYIYK